MLVKTTPIPVKFDRQNTFKTKSLTDFVSPGIKKCVYFADTGIVGNVGSEPQLLLVELLAGPRHVAPASAPGRRMEHMD